MYSATSSTRHAAFCGRLVCHSTSEAKKKHIDWLANSSSLTIVPGDMLFHAHNARETYEKMATEWYYQIMNDVVGPLTSSQLAARVRSGQVKEDTLIRKDDSQWVPARQVNGLLESAMKDQNQRICPYCGSKVDHPPTVCRGCNRKLVLSFNSKITALARHRKTTAGRIRRDHQAEIEVIRQATERGEILRYSVLLVLWLALLIAAPYLIYLATTGKLLLTGNLRVIAMAAVIALVGGVYYWISRLL